MNDDDDDDDGDDGDDDEGVPSLLRLFPSGEESADDDDGGDGAEDDDSGAVGIVVGDEIWFVGREDKETVFMFVLVLLLSLFSATTSFWKVVCFKVRTCRCC